MTNDSDFKDALFLKQFQLREIANRKLTTGLVLVDYKESGEPIYIEVEHINVDFAWILTLFTLSKFDRLSQDEAGYVNIELRKITEDYMSLEGPDCISILKNKHPFYREILGKTVTAVKRKL